MRESESYKELTKYVIFKRNEKSGKSVIFTTLSSHQPRMANSFCYTYSGAGVNYTGRKAGLLFSAERGNENWMVLLQLFSSKLSLFFLLKYAHEIESTR